MMLLSVWPCGQPACISFLTCAHTHLHLHPPAATRLAAQYDVAGLFGAVPEDDKRLQRGIQNVTVEDWNKNAQVSAQQRT
jgi:hypothetical protein